MFREHAPIIAVALVSALLFYLVFRDLRMLRSAIDSLASQTLVPSAAAVVADSVPALPATPTTSDVAATETAEFPVPPKTTTKPATKRS